jgi:hypothetical protein
MSINIITANPTAFPSNAVVPGINKRVKASLAASVAVAPPAMLLTHALHICTA